MLTQDRLKQLLHYDPETGLFTWLVSTARCVKVGDVAGAYDKKGYRVIQIDGKQYQAHRLAFLYMTGKFPTNGTDHIDGDPANNRWTNLRECTTAENAQNTASRKNSSSKYLGVSWFKRDQKWKAQIQINGEQKYLGQFDTEDEAYQAYCKAKADFHTFNPTPRGNHYER
jgi:hypothetical protein